MINTLSLAITLAHSLTPPRNKRAKVTDRDRDGEVNRLEDLGDKNDPNRYTQSEVESTGSHLQLLCYDRLSDGQIEIHTGEQAERNHEEKQGREETKVRPNRTDQVDGCQNGQCDEVEAYLLADGPYSDWGRTH